MTYGTGIRRRRRFRSTPAGKDARESCWCKGIATDSFTCSIERTGSFCWQQFIRELTWAKGVGEDGRPIKIAGQEPSPRGTRVCPSQDGATNWYSPSYSPQTGLFYMQTLEQCSIYTKRREEFAVGREFLGGAQRTDPSRTAERILRALDIQTGLVKWELPEAGSANSWGGTLATASGLVFFGEDSGDFAAADATTG